MARLDRVSQPENPDDENGGEDAAPAAPGDPTTARGQEFRPPPDGLGGLAVHGHTDLVLAEQVLGGFTKQAGPAHLRTPAQGFRQSPALQARDQRLGKADGRQRHRHGDALLLGLVTPA